MYISTISSLIAAFVTFGAQASQPTCRPFRIHTSATLPAAPPLTTKLTECIAHYTALDHDQDGVKDWAVAEGTNGSVLHPADEDMDGDGVTNVLDAQPLGKINEPALDPAPAPLTRNEIPAHLAMTAERGKIQKEIYEKVGVLAIDHTDEHSLAVLEAFRDVALRALSPGFAKKAPSLKYLYAFKGHDSRSNIAAYHRETKALSIGGISSWRGKISSEDRVRILAALAHETGHAFLFDRMSPSELSTVGGKFGEWSKVVARSPAATGFHDSMLLREKHPLHRLAGLARGAETGLWSATNIVSRYATTNMHEWFADAFAADVLNRLGERGHLPATDGDWRKSLAILPRDGAWWANYNNVSPGFRLWMKAKFEGLSRASVITGSATAD